MNSSEYDQRQYQLMAKSVQQFKEGELDIYNLISIIEALLDVLQMADEKWKDDVRNEWWTLEQVYAVAVHKGQTTLSPEDIDLVLEAVENIDTLVIPQLE